MKGSENCLGTVHTKFHGTADIMQGFETKPLQTAVLQVVLNPTDKLKSNDFAMIGLVN